jgi:hypothetical protein
MSIAKTTVDVSGPVASPREDRSAAALATSAAMATSDAMDRALYRVAGAAVLALAALMVGGVAMALTSAAGTSTADVLAAIGTNP